jgi:hypothetical protein
MSPVQNVNYVPGCTGLKASMKTVPVGSASLCSHYALDSAATTKRGPPRAKPCFAPTEMARSSDSMEGKT